MYSPGANQLGFSTNGIAAITIDSNQLVTFSQRIYVADGSANNPSLSFANAITTGFYKVSAGTLGITTNSVQAGSISSGQAWFIGSGTSFTGFHTIYSSGTLSNIALQLAGGAASSFVIAKDTTDGSILITGSTGGSTGGIIQLFGNTHASLANKVIISTAGTAALTFAADQSAIFSSTVTGASFIPTSSSAPTVGLYKPGTNQVALSTNSVQGFLLDSVQTFTIGSTNSNTGTLLGGDSGLQGSSLALKVSTIGGGADAAGTFGITRSVSTGSLVVGGSSAGNTGGRIQLYGSTHASQASKIFIVNGSANTVIFDATNNLRMQAIGSGLCVAEGSNAKQGTSTLVGGTATVSNTSVTASSRIFLTAQSLGTVAIPSALAVTARSAGTSFTITASAATDTSVVAWEIFEPS